MNTKKIIIFIVALVALVAVSAVGVWYHFDDIKAIFDNSSEVVTPDEENPSDNVDDVAPEKDPRFYVEVEGVKYTDGTVKTIDLQSAEYQFIVNLPEGVNDYEYKLIPYTAESAGFDVVDGEGVVYSFAATTDFTRDLDVESAEDGFTVKAFSLDGILRKHYGDDYQLLGEADYDNPLFLLSITAGDYQVRFKLKSCEKLIVSITPDTVVF